MLDPPLPLEPDFNNLNDPFYRFVDNRLFYYGGENCCGLIFEANLQLREFP
jgi:hypothetical protein